MQNEHFIPGKDASLEHSIAAMQARLAALGFQLEECSWLNPVDNVWSVQVRNREFAHRRRPLLQCQWRPYSQRQHLPQQPVAGDDHR